MPDQEQVTVWQHMPENSTQSINAAVEAAPEAVPSDVSPTFLKADTFTGIHEGGITKNDSLGGTAAFGIDQNAHPGMDVTKLTPQRAQAMRYEYWRAIGGDELARKSPALAEAAYDTAIMSGPDRSKQFLQGAQGDPDKFLQERETFFHKLEAKPAFHGAAVGWENRNRDLRAEVSRNKGPDQIASVNKPQAPQKRNKYVDRRTPSQRLRNMYT